MNQTSDIQQSQSTIFRPSLPDFLVQEAVLAALKEDLGRAGDITTLATIPTDARATAVLRARNEGVIAGLPFVDCAFNLISSHSHQSLKVQHFIKDGASISPGQIIAQIEGSAHSILSAERVALNFLGHLSGIATATNILVTLTRNHKTQITCTRKTTPGLRAFEKYAVRCGGGSNHRFGLDDAILIKDNHIAVAGSITQAIQNAKHYAGHLVKIEIEVDTLEQLHEAKSSKPDVILLDNMKLEDLRSAVSILNDTDIVSEASGNITPSTAEAIAATGVDYISSGYITHSAPNFDIGLDINITQ